MRTGSWACAVAVSLISITSDVAFGQAAKPFKIEIEQEGRVVPTRDHQIWLKRAPFDIVLTLSAESGPAVNASFDSHLFETAKRGMPLAPYFRSGMSMAETEFNAGKDVMIADDANHLWGYQKNFIKFNEVKPAGDQYRCRRTVANLWFAGSDHPIGGTTQPSLYLVLVRGEFEKTGTRQIVEEQREYVTLRFSSGGEIAVVRSEGSKPTEAGGAKSEPRIASTPASPLPKEGAKREPTSQGGSQPTLADLEKTCAQGKSQDCLTLGGAYESRGAPQDLSRAAGLYRQGCDSGLPQGCVKYGVMAERGSGVPKDAKEGVEFYDKACHGGDATGCLFLGINQFYGVGIPKNVEAGGALIDQSCLKAGLPLACLSGGRIAATLIGAAAEEDKAITLFKKGCELKDRSSCFYQDVISKTPQYLEAWKKPNADYTAIAGLLNSYIQLVPLGPRSKGAYDALEDCAIFAKQYQVVRTVAEKKAKAGRNYTSPGLLAYADFLLSKPAEAATALDADQKAFPGDARVSYVRSKLEYFNRNWLAAQTAAEQAIGLFEHNQALYGGTGLARYGLHWAHSQRAWALLQRGEFKEAEKEADRWEALPRHNKTELDRFREKLHESKVSLLYVFNYFQEPVTLGTYHLLGDKDAPAGAFAHFVLNNLDKRDRTFQVELGLPDVTQRLSQSVTILKESSKDLYLTPPLKLDFNAKLVREERQVPIETKIVEKLPSGDKIVLDDTRPIVLKPREFLPRGRKTADGVEPKNEFVGAWITPNSEVVEQFLTAAKQRMKDRMFLGPQMASFPQVKALWQEMQSRGVSYVMDPDALSDTNFYQRLRLPSEVLSSTNAQCLEGSIVFATLLEAIQLKPFLVYVPQHAFVGWDLTTGDAAAFPGARFLVLETTMVSSATFEDAVKKALDEVVQYKTSTVVVRVDQLRQKRFLGQPGS